MSMKAKMNHHLLLWWIAIVLSCTAGCSPRHPPHTPKPLVVGFQSDQPGVTVAASNQYGHGIVY
jgi:hypothetical protein